MNARALVVLVLLAACGDITTASLGSGADAAIDGTGGAGVGGAGVGGAGVGGAGVGGAGVGGAGVDTCEPACVPTCGASATAAGCRACPAVDGGSPVMACGPEGFQLCCRFAPSGRAYCSGGTCP